MPADPLTTIETVIDEIADSLVDLRRDLHRHPELAWTETRTTDVVAERLEQAGWRITRMPRSGLVADLGSGGRLVALRADIDALPVQDVCEEPWASSIDGVAHACGHDAHAAILVGTALALAELHEQGILPGRVRLLLQPAEEVMDGAQHLIEHGALADVDEIFALHCDPTVDVGEVGLTAGALTSAADIVEVHLEGPGGHTSRPHLTGDLTFALAKVATELQAIISRRMDPRAGVSVVWGLIRAGAAPNVIPGQGLLSGTVRIRDTDAWAACEEIVHAGVADIVRPYGVTARVDYRRGVPPVVNEVASNALIASAVEQIGAIRGVVEAPQSLGGEDFGWYLTHVPGAMVRLGTRTPGGATYDLHQGNLRIDEAAIGLGARLLAVVAHHALTR